MSKKNNRKQDNQPEKHSEPVELYQLPCLVHVQGRQPEVVGQLDGEEDDWVEAKLEG